MESGFEALHKILKDKTRRRIILLLESNGSLSYTLLMKTLEIQSTGKLNYHLKILEELVAKRDDGYYMLTERGKMAAKLLREFPETEKKGGQKILKRKDAVWITISNGLFALTMTFLYDQGAISTTWFYGFLGLFVVASILAIVLTAVPMPVRKPLTPKRVKWGYVAFGGWLGSIVGFFGGGLMLAGFLRFLGIRTTDLVWVTFWVLDPIIGVLLGAIVGYWYFTGHKYNGFLSRQ